MHYHGKGRLDKWYKLAKEKGYRARAAFKLIQLNKKYNFLGKSKVLIDLCAAPGSWCQVAAETMPINSLIIGVDLTPIRPIPRTITFQSDITTDKCRATIRQHLKTWKADTVLHDGAPNVGTAWVQDAFTQAELALQAMKLATEFLAEGGTFVTKVFRSKDYNSLMWVFSQLFTKVEATKPPASRNVSAEIFVVCCGFKAPKRIDPKFLDPRSVFAELADPTPNNEAKVFNPEKKKRKRDGYEEGDHTQFKEAPVTDFIQTTDPIAMLGGFNKLSFEHKQNRDIALAALEKLPETTREIQDCCADLKVLGRKEFRSLLKWRLKVREIFGLALKKTSAGEKREEEEVANVSPMDEELRIQEELQRLNEQESGRRKRERRKENERKQKEIVRMQLHMTAPTEIGLEQSGPNGEDAMFALKMVDKAGAVDKLAKGKMNVVISQENPKIRNGATERPTNSSSKSKDKEGDADEDVLERELDSMYEQYQARRSDTDTKYRAKKARKEHDDGEWEGFSEKDDSSDDDAMLNQSSDDSSDTEERGNLNKPLITALAINGIGEGGLTRQATIFFDQEIFKGINGLSDSAQDSEHEFALTERVGSLNARLGGPPDSIKDEQPLNGKPTKPKTNTFNKPAEIGAAGPIACDSANFELVERTEEVEGWQEHHKPQRDSQSDIDIITAEAMTLAQGIASGKKTKQDLMDEGYNKYAFRDKDGLPEWFLDDENKHSKPHRPITAAGAAAVKEKLRALNARPIKKVREAKDRKKFKAAQRLERLRKKSALLVDDEGMTEKEKASNITKLMSKAAKKKPKQKVKVVVARGGNKGISGRPRGVKGKYKIVDARLRKDVRAEKRLAKKRK
ncbi:AdoMet-dependent rRNA methyltransferase spb1 [Glutinoglossum americanum]|uniref:AdoMet-dependent rRNA methyltransferase spb1 n=1 Tax=Glutinoglossum americanum TaxID=1670608 RepID=A0A9P8HY67_9PEZI|nr:AdoMet-dependent rRNA methyltransferase spb1 [Glutinoglossum americanum]